MIHSVKATENTEWEGSIDNIACEQIERAVAIKAVEVAF